MLDRGTKQHPVSIIRALMMEAVRTSETSADNHFTRQYNPEDSSEQDLLFFVFLSVTRANTANIGAPPLGRQSTYI
jgi:hypothetical protein